MDRPEPLAVGLDFPEGPRWHDGRLWFSDMHAGKVLALDLDGNLETVAEVPGGPSGLGWLPDGRLLVVSMQDRRLLRLDPDGLQEVADLTPWTHFHANDMLVDAEGRAYVGNFGFDLHGGGRPRTTNLVLVRPDGSCEVAASELSFPNGTVLSPDGGTLIVGETFAACLTAFDVASDGRLSNRRIWARMERALPDGICLDAEGAVWVASPVSSAVLRIREGGEVTDRVEVSTQAFACMLGGPERRTLFICTAAEADPAKTGSHSGRIEAVEVEVPGAGLP